MCKAMAPPERIECVPTSSGANPSLAHLIALCPEENDDYGGAERAETWRGRVFADCGGQITAMFALAEEDVDTRLNWADRWALQS